MRKFTKKELDFIYSLLKVDEEVLWKSKPNLIPDFTALTTLLLFFIAMMIMTFIVASNPQMELWYLLTIIVIDLGIVIYTCLSAHHYYHQNKDLFYLITNSRLLIVDARQEKIVCFKRYNTIRVLRIKKTVFNTASIIFDVDFSDDKLKEIGFTNVNNAEDVLKLIKTRVSHLRIN